MKTIEISEQESVDIHNAVIFMANDLMEDIQELENWINSLPPEEVKPCYREELEYKQKRWDSLVALAKKAGEAMNIHPRTSVASPESFSGFYRDKPMSYEVYLWICNLEEGARKLCDELREFHYEDCASQVDEDQGCSCGTQAMASNFQTYFGNPKKYCAFEFCADKGVRPHFEPSNKFQVMAKEAIMKIYGSP